MAHSLASLTRVYVSSAQLAPWPLQTTQGKRQLSRISGTRLSFSCSQIQGRQASLQIFLLPSQAPRPARDGSRSRRHVSPRASSIETFNGDIPGGFVKAPAEEESEEAVAAAQQKILAREEIKSVRRQRRKARRAQPKRPLDVDWGWDGEAPGDLTFLETWLQQKGLPPQKASLQAVSEGGRGLVANQTIENGETILFVPEQALITLDTVYSCPRIGAVLKEAKLPDWPSLAVFLVSEAFRGSESSWASYIQALPRRPFCILSWDLEEVDDLLEGSAARSKAIECIAEVNNTFLDLENQIFSKYPDMFPEEVFTPDAVRWAFGILFSRLVRLPSAGGKVALVPWGDMLNHKCEVAAHLDWDQSKQAVVLKVDRKYLPGQQVFASYGSRSNGDLLLAYGIVPAARNPSDAVELVLGLTPNDPIKAQKEAALAAVGISSPKKFPVKMEGLPAQLLAFAQLAAAGPTTSVATLKELAAASASGSSDGTSSASSWKPSLEEEIEARDVVLAACRVALSGYTTSVQEDDELAAELQDEDVEVEEGMKAMAAAALRKTERRILNRADFVLRAELRELRGMGPRTDGKIRVDLGNNLAGKRVGLLDKILRKVVRP